MPVVGIPVDMLVSRLPGERLAPEQLVEHLQHLGCDVEGYATVRRFRCGQCSNIMEITETENAPLECDRCGASFRQDAAILHALSDTRVLRMELLAVRPDMFDPGGLARALRLYLGRQAKPSHYSLKSGRCSVRVGGDIASEACQRPYIVCAKVNGITLDDDKVRAVMKLQENLHWALGRDRKHASIGVYDADTLKGREFVYRSMGPEELRFVPLGCDPAEKKNLMTPREILTEHPKGKAYAHLLQSFTRYPVLLDSAGIVLSMPPIINSEQTKVTAETRNFFIDVTGTDERLISRALNILVTSLAELDPKVELEQVQVIYEKRKVMTPDLTPQRVTLEAERTAKIIGVALDRGEVKQLLGRMGHEVMKDKSGLLDVAVPAYRNDVMHPIDLVEDVAIAYGYHNIKPTLIPTLTITQEQPIERVSNICRGIMTGLNFFEVLTLILSNEAMQFEKLLLPRADDVVEIANPISVEQTIIRRSLVPGLLDTLSLNANHELPQHIFEVGNVTQVDSAAETGAVERRLLASALIGPKVDYAEIRSITETLLREFGWKLIAEPLASPMFIPGRGAQIWGEKRGERTELGAMGELHPQVLENFGLVYPVATCELNVHALSLTDHLPVT